MNHTLSSSTCTVQCPRAHILYVHTKSSPLQRGWTQGNIELHSRNLYSHISIPISEYFILCLKLMYENLHLVIFHNCFLFVVSIIMYDISNLITSKILYAIIIAVNHGYTRFHDMYFSKEIVFEFRFHIKLFSTPHAYNHDSLKRISLLYTLLYTLLYYTRTSHCIIHIIFY